jgi:hypothetical protein
MKLFLAIALWISAAIGLPAIAAESADLELVLVVDVSRSINDQEFELQRQGYAAALIHPRVLAAIRAGALGRVALCYVEFAGAGEQAVVVDWSVVADGESAQIFADRIRAAPRPFAGRTSISGGIDFAVQQIAGSGVDAPRRVIDVSGDGTNNSGRTVNAARDDAVAAGITINGLAIINEHPDNPYLSSHVQPPEGLPEYYRQNVIGGPGAFMLQVKDFTSFAESVTRKLISEIAALRQPAPRPDPNARHGSTEDGLRRDPPRG